jgi:hypothetical protein
MFSRPSRYEPYSQVPHLFLIFAILLTFLLLPFSARADVKYPAPNDFQAFQNVCAGGNIHEVSAHLDAALQAWRLKPGGQTNLDLVIRDLGAVMEKVKQDSPLYVKYVDCVQNLILHYLQQANPVPVKPATSPAAGKP